jgi:hypothetical protein
MPTSRIPAAVLGGPTWISPLVRVTACLYDAFGEVEVAATQPAYFFPGPQSAPANHEHRQALLWRNVQ